MLNLRVLFLLVPLVVCAPLAEDTEELPVRTNKVFRVSLEADHSTGYVWILKSTPETEKLVDMVRNYFQTDEGTKGHQIFALKTKGASGTANLVFEYKRPFDSHPLREKTIKLVSVAKSGERGVEGAS
ncbi:hypothetical protein PAPYR_3587 [Paratrimastix pyriformis]|uniref:Proteinase inhibitor I42 chagasin domain-containing protein n=1 Tax=Paratrimastix pyriformis TaxID=342808 RepID=A0ABQ8ULY9_9EUKA|nr:hypothetical protein PAPYR_3587 [Paratrimastix pyriformis]